MNGDGGTLYDGEAKKITKSQCILSSLLNGRCAEEKMLNCEIDPFDDLPDLCAFAPELCNVDLERWWEIPETKPICGWLDSWSSSFVSIFGYSIEILTVISEAHCSFDGPPPKALGEPILVQLGPLTSIAQPADGETVSGTVELRGLAAADGARVLGVELWLDGEHLQLDGFTLREPIPGICGPPLQVSDLDCPSIGFSGSLDTTTLLDGPHRLQVVSYDDRLPTPAPTLYEHTIVVDNCGAQPPPSIALNQPLEGATVTVPLTIEAAAGSTTDSVRFLLDGAPIAVDGSAPWQTVWNPPGDVLGQHQLRAEATDACGRTASSAPITVEVVDCLDVTPPNAWIWEPLDGSTLSGTVTLKASGTSDIERVWFLLDGVAVGEDPTVPYRHTWDSTQTANGAHTVQVRAVDGCDNVFASEPIGVTVANVLVPDLVVREVNAGIPGAVLVHGSVFTFPDPTVPGAAMSRRFRIENQGLGDLVLSDPSGLLPATGGCFWQIEDPAPVIAPGAASHFRVRVLCADGGEHASPLRVVSNDPEGTFQLTVAATVLAPVMRVTRDDDATKPLYGNGSVVGLGQVEPADSVQATMRIDNDGTADLSIDSVSLSGTCYTLDAPPPASMPPDGSGTLLVGFSCPGGSGTYTATATLRTNVPNDDPFLLHFTADVVAPPPNQPPIAVDDTASTAAGWAVTVAVTANDWDPDGDPLSVVDAAVAPPDHGTAVKVSAGQVEYTPDPGFVGTDTFRYEIGDFNGHRRRAWVTVTVGGG